MTRVRERRLALDDSSDVAATVHLPADRVPAGRGSSRRRTRPVLLLPGARGDHAAAHLVALAEHLADEGHLVVRSALSSRPPGSGVVGPAERSIGRLRMILAGARRLDEAVACGVDVSAGWVIGGASYGGRVASLAVAERGAEDLGVIGLLLVAYPLHPPGRADRPRVAHWPDVDVPTLMISGDADPFLTLELLERHAPDLAGPLTRVIVEGARHDLSVGPRSAPDGVRRTPAEVIAAHARTVQDWIEALPEDGRRAH